MQEWLSVAAEEEEENAAAQASAPAQEEQVQAAALSCLPAAACAAPRSVQVELEPHRGSPAALRALAPFYRAGRTPFYGTDGEMRVFDVAPADAATTGSQLGTIQERFGREGVARTIEGLNLTRGAEFTSRALRYASSGVTSVAKAAMVDEGDAVEPVAAAPARAETVAAAPARAETASRASSSEPRTVAEPQIGGHIAGLLSQSRPGSALQGALRRRFARATGDSLADVRIHHDSAAHAAADLLNARAFTIGRSIYFGAGEFNPSSAEGQRLLAHEVAHAAQHRGVDFPSNDKLRVGSESDPAEVEADNFAALSPRRRVSLGRGAGKIARLRRAIRFSRSNDTFTRNSLVVNENAAGFTIQRNTAPLFGWVADVTISGNPGDPFANFEVGPHQVVRSFRGEFTWGTGANRGRRVLTVSTLPIRDATAAANTWYHDPFARAFSANGDVRNTGLNDSPSPGTQPWNNPVAGKVGNSGTMAFTAAFVAYISARDTTRGTGAGAFTALNCLYWNSSISGTFNAANALGSRVTATGGNVNRGGVISGGSGEFPSMHGGAIANNSFTTTDT